MSCNVSCCVVLIETPGYVVIKKQKKGVVKWQHQRKSESRLMVMIMRW